MALVEAAPASFFRSAFDTRGTNLRSPLPWLWGHWKLENGRSVDTLVFEQAYKVVTDVRKEYGSVVKETLQGISSNARVECERWPFPFTATIQFEDKVIDSY